MGLPNITDPTSDFELPYEDFSFQADPETEMRAAVAERMGIEHAAVSQTIMRVMVFVDADASGGEVILKHRAVWGNTASVAPTLLRNSAGNYTLTWGGSYEDLNPTPSKRVTNNVNFELAGVSLAEATGGFCNVVATANTLRVRSYNAAGAPTDIDFVVWAA